MEPHILKYPIRVGILYSCGSGGDNIDTLETVETISKALRHFGHMVRIVEVTKKNWRQAVKIPGDVIINLVEDENWSLYMKVAQRLEWLGRAQMAHDIKSLKFVIKKARVKRKMHRVGIATPKFRIFNRRSNIQGMRRISFPLIVKPSGQHAGVGISQHSVVTDIRGLEEQVKYLFANYPGEVIAEEFVEGREVHATVVGNGNRIYVLPLCEIEFKGEFKNNWAVYTYEAKWEKDTWEYWGARVRVPADLDEKMNKRIERLALKTYREFGCRDIARVDIRVNKKGKPFVVDLNISPSLNNADLQDATIKSAEALGWSYEQLIEKLVELTYKRVYGVLPERIRERHFLLSAPNIL